MCQNPLKLQEVVSGVLHLTTSISSGGFSVAFEQLPLLLTVLFPRLTVSSFQIASVTTRNFLT